MTNLAIYATLRPGDSMSDYWHGRTGPELQTAEHADATPEPWSVRRFRLPLLSLRREEWDEFGEHQPHGDSGRIVEREP